MNLQQGKVENGRFLAGELSVPLDAYSFEREVSGDMWFGIRPEHVLVGDEAAGADLELAVKAEVVEPLGSDTLVLTSVNGKRFWLRISGQSKVASGDSLRVGVNAADASLFDAGDEKRL